MLSFVVTISTEIMKRLLQYCNNGMESTVLLFPNYSFFTVCEWYILHVREVLHHLSPRITFSTPSFFQHFFGQLC